MKKTDLSVGGMTKKKNIIIGLACFFLPALIMYLIFAFNKVHPFGDGQILVTDLWHQYYPFLCELQQKLKAGESLLYSENLGLGVNFWALIGYYCASPLNLLVALVPKEMLRDLVVVIVCLKVGFCGLFFSVFLKKIYSKYDLTTIVFSLVYAFCGYIRGYYWNIMWLDCVMLLPLVITGVYLLVKENRYKMYVISLAVAVFSNFYIGFMMCIFVALYFFYEVLKEKMDLKKFLKKLATIAVASVVALGITAVMIIPSYNALQNTYATEKKIAAKAEADTESFGEKFSENASEWGKNIEKNTVNMVGKLSSFGDPSPKEGLPNLFSGLITIVLLGLFFSLKNISLREKIVTAVFVFIMLVSHIISDINIIWHGFHKTNMVPYRYAFMLSFLLAAVAYRAYTAFVSGLEEKKINGKNNALIYVLPIIASLIVILCSIEKTTMTAVLASAVLALIYVALIYVINARGKSAKTITNILCAVIACEMIINMAIAVPVVRITKYSGYYYRGPEIERLLDAVDAKSSHKRVEISQENILNDPALYGYKGVSIFSSTANYPVTALMEKIGIAAPPRVNRYYYETTTPLTNAFLGIDHIIFKNDMKNLNPYLEPVAEEWTEDEKYKNVIYKNNETLPLGFMADEAFLDGDSLSGDNSFEYQNDLFKKLTGINEDLFTRIPLLNVASGSNVGVSHVVVGDYTIKETHPDEEAKLMLNYVAPDENSIYAYIYGKDIAKVKVGGASYKADKRNYAFPVGKFEAGEKFKFTFEISDEFEDKTELEFQVYSMNDALFKKGMEKLRDEEFEISEYESTKIAGKINALQDGVFFMSVPYEKGWTAYVDGEKKEITPFENAMIAFELSQGEHEIVLKYVPHGFVLGSVISLISIAAFVAFCLISKKKEDLGGEGKTN